MIQHLKNNIHREKTEKFELRRLLQEARDDLESKRKVIDSAGKKRNLKQQDLNKKQIRPDRLGASRSMTEEITENDPEWEDHDLSETPSKPPVKRTPVIGLGLSHSPRLSPSPSRSSGPEPSSDTYQTATENSDAFETANEQEATNTETDAFHTGAETLDGDSDDGDLTETDSGPRFDTVRNRPTPPIRVSYQSTASTDDEEDFEARTPVQAQHPRFKLRICR